ncbi:hypothetical protein Pint_30946 [Pistacia integerrima]|uniref:Uncharacterized protein n=1 Tax=Pistacia integerrima TaxID=434235 RepID=A0ACC0XP18_9ROSI|nr:hypothetical protein Pint_30946 [Pistacia integerrima]
MGLLATSCPQHNSLDNSFTGFYDHSAPALINANQNYIAPVVPVASSSYQSTPQYQNTSSNTSNAAFSKAAPESLVSARNNYQAVATSQIVNDQA